MNKNDLVGSVAEHSSLTKADAARAVDAVFASIEGALKSGDFAHIAGIGRGADVGIHLALAGDADRHRLQIGVIDVGGDDHAAPCHLLHHQRFGQVLPLGHVGHFFGHHTLAGVVHLAHIGVTTTLLNPGAAHEGAGKGGQHPSGPMQNNGHGRIGAQLEFVLTSLRHLYYTVVL